MKKLFVSLALALLSFALHAQGNTPRAEYPRPQFQRADWINLNGTWTYTFDFGNSGKDRNLQAAKSFDGQITVPFCPESKLSGISHTDFINQLWYQRNITIPTAWKNKKILLNFGAVNYLAEIYIDGNFIARHYGSGASFSVDITRFAKAGETHNLVVYAHNDVRSGLQTGGKQSGNYYSKGCMYTRVTGIWQTVWMEAVDSDGLKSVYAIPDIDQQQLVIHPQFYHESDGTLDVTLMDGNKTVAHRTVNCANNDVVVLPVKGMKIWSPESPFLYTLLYKVKDANGKVVDEVKSYAGMRKIQLKDGYFYLNNKPYFQRLVLDQGFYPDGIWTAPSDNDLKNDIELSKAAGFNGARLHQKVFEERYYYWADKLGYLTWGESSSWGLDENNELAARNFIGEWSEIVTRDRNHPCLVTWTPFNETWSSQPGTYERMITDVYHITKAIDSTRPINDASGDAHVMTDIWSVHNYEHDAAKLQDQLTFKPGVEPYRNQPNKKFLAVYEGQPYMLDEFGGIGWIKPEDRKNSWGYGGLPDNEEEYYKRLQGEVDAIKACKNVCGFCYTQLTDVEQEKNGIYYYNRTPKLDIKRIKAIFEHIPAYITTFRPSAVGNIKH